ncbi:MAG: hypothetical protein IKR18_03715 [Bacteroidaceae bacterium]|nr:hypothetical protein [Bacteroidaceae bacterium]
MKTRLLSMFALLFMLAANARADNKKVEIVKVDSTTWQFTMPDREVELEMAFTDGTTAVISIKDGKVKNTDWYDVNGRRLPGEPEKTGIYVRNGKVVIVDKRR